MSDLPLFAYGTLQDQDILSAVLGQRLSPARLLPAGPPGHGVRCYPGRAYPALIRSPGTSATGLLLLGLTDTELVAVDGYEGDEYRRAVIAIEVDSQARHAFAYLPTKAIPHDSVAWTFETWVLRHKAAALAEARLARQGLK